MIVSRIALSSARTCDIDKQVAIDNQVSMHGSMKLEDCAYYLVTGVTGVYMCKVRPRNSARNLAYIFLQRRLGKGLLLAV